MKIFHHSLLTFLLILFFKLSIAQDKYSECLKKSEYYWQCCELKKGGCDQNELSWKVVFIIMKDQVEDEKLNCLGDEVIPIAKYLLGLKSEEKFLLTTCLLPTRYGWRN
ncbi:MAG: hypothetical protein KTR13_05340 [Saprospiraceae bacterium]|nr:hypothetical protein [Saprospiraceae bacterium]